MSHRTADLHASGLQIRNLRELRHDPYAARKKLEEPTVCKGCGAIYHHGRWQWGMTPTNAKHALCPACQRIHDHCPAGFLHLSGAYLAAHKTDILQLVQHVIARENSEHPLKRMMTLEDRPDGGLDATFTDPHLARAIGEAIHDAHQGELAYAYQAGEFLLRVNWQR